MIYNLPSAFLCGVRVKHIDAEYCRVHVRHKWINKNPFKSMFWAVQGMAAELSTGALIIMKIKKLNRNISMLVIKNEAQFTKKAKGQIIFSCTQGQEIDMLLQKAIETGIGQTMWMYQVIIQIRQTEKMNIPILWQLNLLRGKNG